MTQAVNLARYQRQLDALCRKSPTKPLPLSGLEKMQLTQEEDRMEEIYAEYKANFWNATEEK
jgi:hypothetical protein